MDSLVGLAKELLLGLFDLLKLDLIKKNESDSSFSFSMNNFRCFDVDDLFFSVRLYEYFFMFFFTISINLFQVILFSFG